MKRNSPKEKTILVIDTSDTAILHVGLIQNGIKKEMQERIEKQKNQRLLSLIDRLLLKYRLQLKDINAIKVNTYSLSFTGVRVGISIANALGYALKIPINSKKVGEIEKPIYR